MRQGRRLLAAPWLKSIKFWITAIDAFKASMTAKSVE
jgi:hypothetical protein